jgi:hypothetical protein
MDDCFYAYLMGKDVSFGRRNVFFLLFIKAYSGAAINVG